MLSQKNYLSGYDITPFNATKASYALKSHIYNLKLT